MATTASSTDAVMEDVARDCKEALTSQSATVASGSKTVQRTPVTSMEEAGAEEPKEEESTANEAENDSSQTPDDSVGLKRKLAFDEVCSVPASVTPSLSSITPLCPSAAPLVAAKHG